MLRAKTIANSNALLSLTASRSLRISSSLRNRVRPVGSGLLGTRRVGDTSNQYHFSTQQVMTAPNAAKYRLMVAGDRFLPLPRPSCVMTWLDNASFCSERRAGVISDNGR